MTEEETIPISKVKALIEHHEGHGIAIDYDDTDVIRILKSLLPKEPEQQEPFQGIASCYYCGKIITEDQEKTYIYLPSLDMGKEKKPIHESCSRRYT